MRKLKPEQREIILTTIREAGTIQAGADAVGISVKELRAEMKKSAILKKRIKEALEESDLNILDRGRQLVRDYIDGKVEKTDRNRLTAALAWLNWKQPGFRGTTKVEGRIDYDVRVITAVPRPKYDEIPSSEFKLVEAPKEPPKKTVKTEIRDENGNIIAIKRETVEDVIEGVAIEVKESENEQVAT